MVAIKLPQYTTEDILKGNKLYGRNRPVHFALGSKQYSCTFLKEEFKQPISHSIEFKVGDEDSRERFWLLTHQSPVMDMFSKALEDIHFNELPDDIALIAAMVILEDPLKFFAAKLGEAVNVLSISHGRSRNAPVEGVNWVRIPFSLSVLNSKDPFLAGVWLASKEMVEHFMRVLDNIPMITYASYDFLTVDVSVEVGRTRLSSAECFQIGANDIILLDDPSTFLSKSVYCRLEKIGLQFMANFQENHLTVKTPMNPEETPPPPPPSKPRATASAPAATHAVSATSAHSAATPASSAVSAIENFNVDLVFQVGQTSLSIKELKTLKPGYTFDLGKPVSEAVSIVANGQVIGSGELLQIENHLGVRVIEFIQQ